MKIAVMAAGAVGGYFGARFIEGGHEVSLVARGAHLDAIRANGLAVESDLGDALVKAATVTDDAADIGPVDVVLFAVKLWDTEAAANACKPLMGPDTAILSFQNGVGAADELAAVLGAQHPIGGVAFIGASIARPGVIRHTGTMAKLIFGERDNRPSARVQALLAAAGEAKIEAAIADDIERVLWEKFIFMAALSGTTTAARKPIGGILGDDGLRAKFEAALAETAAVGRARGVALGADIEAATLKFANGLPAEMKSSTLRDLERGNRLESPWLPGAVSRMGAEAGVATPVNDELFAAVEPYIGGS